MPFVEIVVSYRVGPVEVAALSGRRVRLAKDTSRRAAHGRFLAGCQHSTGREARAVCNQYRQSFALASARFSPRWWLTATTKLRADFS